MTVTRPHAVVIGAGFGGLAAAVRLLARGYRVTILERLDAPGGRAYVFRQAGYSFDAGPTIITAPHLLAELWALHGQRMEDAVELKRLDPFYELHFDDGTVFRARADLDAMRAEVARISPHDVAGFERYLAASAAIYRVAFERLADRPFGKISDMLAALPDLLRLGGYRSVYDMAARYFRDPRLRMAFSYHPLLVGGNPFHTTAYYGLIAHLERAHGVHYAVGGTGAIVAALARLIEGAGGRFRFGADVAQILQGGEKATGVALSNGEQIPADVVVSNADAAWTYGKLLNGAARRGWTGRALARRKFSMGLFVWYFGTNRQFSHLHHHTILLGPRYRGLLDDIFTRKILAEDFSLYLHRPTASDPSVAPPGCDTFYVLSPVPNLASGIDWADVAEPYRVAIQRRLETTLLPGLGATLVTSRVMTPLDFQSRLKSVHGAGFSLEPRLLQSAWFRPHNESPRVKGLFLVGAGTHPGAGVPGVICSARILDRVLTSSGYP